MLEMSKTGHAVCAVSRVQEIVQVNGFNSGKGTRHIRAGEIWNLVP